MIRAALLSVLVALPLTGRAQQVDSAAPAQARADALVAELDSLPTYPPLLREAVLAANDHLFRTRGLRFSPLARELARALTPPEGDLAQARVEAAMLAGLLAARLKPDQLLDAYIAHADYGRGCIGAAAASAGLFGQKLNEAGSEVWLTMAAMLKAPETYLAEPFRLAARRGFVIWQLGQSGQISAAEAKQLDALPPADPLQGPGCP